GGPRGRVDLPPDPGDEEGALRLPVDEAGLVVPVLLTAGRGGRRARHAHGGEQQGQGQQEGRSERSPFTRTPVGDHPADDRSERRFVGRPRRPSPPTAAIAYRRPRDCASAVYPPCI